MRFYAGVSCSFTWQHLSLGWLAAMQYPELFEMLPPLALLLTCCIAPATPCCIHVS